MPQMLGRVLVLIALTMGARAWGATLQPSPLSGETYAESFTAIAEMQDGTYVLLQVFFSNAGLGDQKGACRALLVPASGTAQNLGESVKQGEWSYQSEPRPSLRVGACTLSQPDQGSLAALVPFFMALNPM